MRKITLFFVILAGFVIQTVKAQTPEGFNYQAVLRDNSGELIVNQSVQVRISILNESSGGTTVYSEIHTLNTGANGEINLKIGTQIPETGIFADINWGTDLKFMKVEVDEGSGYTDMGTLPLLSVPFALYAKSASKAEVLGQSNVYSTQSDTLFVVKDHEGNVVFAIFPDGAQLIVNQESKGRVGGFAVSGRSPGKGILNDYLVVTGDSTRIYVNDTLTLKGRVGGFAVSGRSPAKSGENEYLIVTPDSTRIYVNDTLTTKGKVGGFAVSGRSPGKGLVNEYLQVTRDSTRVYIAETTKGSVGGFAVSGRSPGKISEADDYFNISGNTSAEIINPSQARILWYPKKEAFLTGRILVEGPESVGFNSLATGFETKASGNYSQAMGYQSVASGAYSTAIGYQAQANDSNSFAFGNYALALGKNSFAFGDSAIVESEDGYAIGAYAYTSGRGSFAIGSKDRNQYDDIYSTSATGDLAFAIGLDADAMADGSIVVGNESSASGINSVAIGRAADASADYSLALSYGTVTSSGTQSIAMGGGTASNSFSFAQGLGSIASGYISTAIGPYNEATSSYSLAMGYKGKTTGSYATAIGNNVTAQSYSSFVCGYYNIIGGNSATPTATDPLFVIGNGTYITPSNALTVLHNGDMKLKGNFYPVTDNFYDLGTSGNRWNDIYATNNVIQTSDKRYKTEIHDLTYGLNEILQLRPISFKWKDKPEKGLKLGLIAQEVQYILKEVVSVGDDENQTLGITYTDIIPVLIKGIQEQEEKINTLEIENKELKNRLLKIEELLQKLN